MPTAVVLASNIYDEHGDKRLRGDDFECSKEFASMVLSGDEAAERQPRIAVLKGSGK